jgi:ABC-type Fe2+-enterobactin transport system substrate-binding protein
MPTTDILLTVFVAIAAIALLGQWIAIRALSRKIGALADRVAPLVPQVEQSVRMLPPLVLEVQAMVAETRPKLQAVAANVAEITVLARDQVRRADALATDLGERLELQLVRVDEAMSTAMANFEQIVNGVRQTVLRPVQDVNAIVHGVRTGLDFFFRRRSSPALGPRAIYQDEEMFI